MALQINNQELDAPLTMRRFIVFFEKYIEPRLNEIPRIHERIDSFERTVNNHFDFLYKNYETLRQEHVFINHQFNRIDRKFETIDKQLSSIEKQSVEQQEEVKDIKFRISALHCHSQEIYKKLLRYKNTSEKHDDEIKKIAWDLKILKGINKRMELRIDDFQKKYFLQS